MKVFLIVLAVLAVIFLYPLLIMWLIRMVFSDSFVSLVFGADGIGYWQAFGLSWLCPLLCKSSYSYSGSKE